MNTLSISSLSWSPFTNLLRHKGCSHKQDIGELSKTSLLQVICTQIGELRLDHNPTAINSLCTMKKGIKSTLRVATSFLGIILYIFFAPFKAFIGGGGQIDIRLREFQGLFLLIQGVVIKRLALRLKKCLF